MAEHEIEAEGKGSFQGSSMKWTTEGSSDYYYRSPTREGEMPGNEVAGDDDNTIIIEGTSKVVGSEHDTLTSGSLTSWALAKVSVFDTIGVSPDGASQISLASDNEEDDDDDTSRGVASFTSEKGLEAFSVTYDVELPLRYGTVNTRTQHQDQSLVSGSLKLNGSLESKESLMDVTSATSASLSSSPTCASLNETTFLQDDEDEADGNDVDSNMTLGPDEEASTQLDDSSEPDEDVASKASSSEFTPDEFWDWLDNVTVAFIDVGDGKLSGSHKKVTDLSVSATSDLTEANTSTDVGIDTLRSDESKLAAMDMEPGKSKRVLRYSWLEQIDEQCEDGPTETSQSGASWPGPQLKPNASVADFRSAFEQQQQASLMVTCNVRRTASFGGHAVVDDSLDSGSEQLKRISSNEDLLQMLRRKKSLSPARAPTREGKLLASRVHKHGQLSELQARDWNEGAMVCFESGCLPRARRLVIVALSLGVILLTGLHLLPTLSHEAAGAWNPKVASINVDFSQIASRTNADHVLQASKSAALGAYNFVKDRLPESLEEVNVFLDETKMSAMDAYFYLKEHLVNSPGSLKPRMIQLDFKTLASDTIQDVGDLLKISKSAMVDKYHNLYARLEDQRLDDALQRLSSSLGDARVVMIRSLSEMCRSGAVEGPKEAMLKACDAFHEAILDLKVPYEPSMESGVPQLTFNRQLVRDTFDAMANETLEYVSRFATIIHSLCVEVRGHCQRRALSSQPPALEENIHVYHDPVWEASGHNLESESHTLPSLFDHPPSSADQVVQISVDTPVHTATAIPDPGTSSLHQEVEEMSSTSGNESSKMPDDAPKVEERDELVNDSVSVTEANEDGSALYRTEPVKASDAISQEWQRAVRKRVDEILSRLDAKGRLVELEAALVAKFGPDAIDSAKLPLNAASLGSFPLLGSLRDKYRRDLWLDQLEQEIIESTLAGKMGASNKFAWPSNIMRGFGSVLDKVTGRVKIPP